MTWLLIGALVWVALAVPAAQVIARGIRMADAHRVAEAEAQALDVNFVASDVPPADVLPPVDESLPWTGPATVPFPPPAPVQRQRPQVVRDPIRQAERDPSTHDSGLL
jgi:hypothetical protein